MTMGPKVTHNVRNGIILITAEIEGKPVTLHGETWKQIARAVLKSYNAAEHELPPDDVVDRVRNSLADAASRGLEPFDAAVGNRRMASTVLHRLADLIQHGTVDEFDGAWLSDCPDEIEIDVTTRHKRQTTVRIALGRGLIEPRSVPNPEAA